MNAMIKTFPKHVILPSSDYPGVFVFGANTRGIHGSGAARTAHFTLGYPMGLHDELHGMAYGLSTKYRPVDASGSAELVRLYVPDLERCITEHPELMFNITALGTGLAGLTFEAVAPHLAPLLPYTNVRWDERWLPHFASL